LQQGFACAQANARKLAYKEPDRGQALLDSGAVPVNRAFKPCRFVVLSA